MKSDKYENNSKSIFKNSNEFILAKDILSGGETRFSIYKNSVWGYTQNGQRILDKDVRIGESIDLGGQAAGVYIA